jgi:hypothetical protein
MALNDFMDIPGVEEEAVVEEAPVGGLDGFMDLPAATVEEPKVEEVEPEPEPISDAKKFYTQKAFSGPVQGLLPGIVHPALSAELGKRGFGPKPEGGWDEFGRPLDKDLKPYYIEGVDPSKPGNWLANTFKGLSTLASHPMETIKGGLDFLLAMPAMTVGLLGAAGRGMTEIVDQISRLERTQPETTEELIGENVLPGYTTFKQLNLENIYDALSKGMQESFEFFETGKRPVIGEPTEESQLMTEVLMVPLTVPSALGHKVSEYEGFKDSPNVRGAAKLLGDTVGFITMGLAFHGLFGAKKAGKLESIVKEADELRIKEQAVQAIPDDLARGIQQKVLDIQKQRLESKAAEFAKELGDDALVIEEMGRLKEEVAKAKSRPVKSTKLRKRKVVEEPANIPSIVYRGSKTGAEFPTEGKPIHFSNDPRKAQGYPEGKGNSLGAYKIELKNPKIYNGPLEKGKITFAAGAEDVKSLKKQGFDGAIYVEDGITQEIVAFDRSQVKRTRIPKDVPGKLREAKKTILLEEEPAKPSAEEAQALADAKKIADLEKFYDKPVEKISDKEVEDYFTDEKIDYFGEGKRVTEVDRAAGEKIPELEGETSTFMQSKKKTDQMAEIYSERQKAVSESPELYVQKLINDVNRWYHGDENVDIDAVRNKLSEMASRAPEMRELFINGVDHLQFSEVASEAANWARGLEKGKGVQLNVMIPVDQIPGTVFDFIYKGKEAAKDLIGYLRRDKVTLGKLYRNKELFDETGFWLGRDGKWRYEIDDSKANYNPSKFMRDNYEATGKTTGTVGDMIDYPELFKAVPGIEKMQVDVRSNWGPLGTYKSDLDILVLRNFYKDVFFHELQHAINEKAGAFEGSSPEYFQMMGESNPFTKYQKVPGEMEARLAEERLGMSKEQRAKTPPWDTLDRMLLDEGVIGLEDFERIGSKTYSKTGTKLYSGIPISGGAKQIVELYKSAKKKGEEARGLKKFDPKVVAKVLREEGVRAIVDRSGNIRREFLEKLGDEGYTLVQLMTLTKGSSSMAANKLRQMTKEVYGGLSRERQKLLNDLIFHSRILDIAKYKSPKEFKELNKYTPEESIVFLEAFKEMEKLSSKEARELYHVKEDGSIGGRVGAYYNWMKMTLKDMKDNGLISETEYNDLSKHNYRRLKVVDLYDKKVPSLKKKGISVYDSGVEKLARGRESTVFERDGRIMALEVFNRAYGRIMKNEANKNLLRLAEKDPNNPFARIKSKDNKIPSGWRTVFAYEGGKRKALHISPEMSKEWITNDPVMTYKASQVVRWLSLSPVTRTFATGINWGFAVANLPRDIFHIWYAARTFENGKWKPLYNSNAPIYAMQMGRDLATVFLDAALKKGRYTDYINEGGGMEFLVHQGRLFQRGRHIEGPMDGMYKVLGYLGETSEVMTRLAIRERVLRKGKSRQEATFAARDYMDFGQGGWATKATDNAIPYLTAGIVGTRGMIRGFKDNPIRSTYKMAQFAGLVAGIYIASKHYAPETTEELKYNIDSQNNLCIPLPDYTRFTDERGQERGIYVKIPLDHGQRFFKKFFEASTDKWLGEEIDAEGTANALTNLSPVGLSSLPPSISGVFGYWMNKDFWLNEDIWRGKTPFSYPKSAKEYSSRTPEMFIDLGEVTKLSPERSKYSVDQIITRDNVFSQLLGAGYEAAFGELPKEKKEQHWAMALSKVPMIKKFIGVTNPYTKYAGKLDVAEEEAVFKRHVENLNFDIKVEGYLYGEKGEVTRDELMKEARSHGDKDTYERLLDRWKFEEAIKNLPNKSFWRRMKGIPLEAKAKVFADRLEGASQEEENELWREYAVVSRAKGIISPEFRKEVMRQMMQVDEITIEGVRQKVVQE